MNSKHYIKIDTINDFRQINHITKNRHNSLSKQVVDQIQHLTNNLFIDKRLMKYRFEFISNCVGMVPYDVWTNARNIADMDPKARNNHTLFLLSPDGYNGFPVGIW